jgi:hypothetical protein
VDGFINCDLVKHGGGLQDSKGQIYIFFDGNIYPRGSEALREAQKYAYGWQY